MLSFYEMNCLLEKQKRRQRKYYETDDPSAKILSLADKIRARKAQQAGQGASAAAPVAEPKPASLEAPAPDAGVGGAASTIGRDTGGAQGAASTIGREPAQPAAAAPAAGGDLRAKLAAAKERAAGAKPAVAKTTGKDVNDPSNKSYTLRGSGGVRGNTTNLSGLEAGLGGVSRGGGSISRQMDVVSTDDRKQRALAILSDKVATTNEIIRSYPTLAYIVHGALAPFGLGKLSHLGKDALLKYKDLKAKGQVTPEADADLAKPFRLALKKGGSEYDDKMGEIPQRLRDTEGVPEIVVPDPKTMGKVLRNIRDFFINSGDPAAQKAAQKLGGGEVAGPSTAAPDEARANRDDLKAKLAALQQKVNNKPEGGGLGPVKKEEKEWMDVYTLMEHWQF